MYSVYEIKCQPIGRSYYGRSQEIEKRWRSHTNMLRNNEHSNTALQSDWNHYGEDAFTFTVLSKFDDLQTSIDEEQRLIDESRGVSYNISNATPGGDTFTFNPRKEEIRELKRLLSSGSSNPMYGKPKSELAIRRIKEANSRPVEIDGKRFASMSDAAKTYGVSVSTVSNRIASSNNKFANWRYATNA